jgi:hypothetical protein
LMKRVVRQVECGQHESEQRRDGQRPILFHKLCGS